jgi:hypothetical protein
MANTPRTSRRKPSSKKTKIRAGKTKPRRAPESRLAEKIAKQAASVSTAEDNLTEAVRAAVAHALREPRPVVSQWFDTVVKKTQEAMTTAQSVGGDVLSSARSVTRGVLLGVSDAGGDTVESAGYVVRTAIASTAEAGSEAAVVGRRALLGAVDAAQTVGTDAAATARRAIDAVAETVLSAGESATGLVDRLIEGATARPKPAAAKRRTKARAKKATAKSRRRS